MLFAILLFIFCYMIFFIGFGYGVDHFFPLTALQNHPVYPALLNIMLGLGIYLSVIGIDLNVVKKDVNLATKVLTLGVGLKILLVIGIIYAFTGNPVACLLGVVVAQIDPISVRVITERTGKSKLLSDRAKNILMLWSSFDAPITVIVTTFMLMFAFTDIDALQTSGANLFFLNLLLPAIGFAIIYLAKQHVAQTEFTTAQKENILLSVNLGVLLGIFILAISYGFIFAIAISALFIRPKNLLPLENALQYLFVFSLFLIGTHLVFPLPLATAAILALACVGAQILTGFFITHGKLNLKDRLYIGFGQQNGLTAVTLALAIGHFVPQSISLAVTAMVMINLSHIALLMALNYKSQRGWI